MKVEISIFLLFAILFSVAFSLDTKKGKKDVADLTDADLERIYEQWEVISFIFSRRYLDPPFVIYNSFSMGIGE